MDKFLKIGDDKLVNLHDVISIEKMREDGKFFIKIAFASGRKDEIINFETEEDMDEFYKSTYIDLRQEDCLLGKYDDVINALLSRE